MKLTNRNVKKILIQIVFFLGLSFGVFGQSTSPVHVTFFGSSVCLGTGAENDHGYAWQFFHSGAIDTLTYRYFNASTGGDNTIKIERADRLTNKLYPTKPDIVGETSGLRQIRLNHKQDNPYL